MNSIADGGFFSSQGADQHPRGGDEVLETSPLQRLWRVFWINRAIVAALLVASVLAALVITLLMTPQYTASARVQINRIQSNVSDVEGLEPTGAALLYEEFYNTQYALLESTALAERVARQLSLADDPEFLEAFDLQDTVAQASTRNATAAVAEVLLEQISITPIRGSSLVDVEFTSPSARLSARIASTWVDEFIKSSVERRFASTNDAREFLQDQLAQLRERLEDSEREFVAYASNSGIISVPGPTGSDTEESGTLVGTDLAAMNAALTRAQTERIEAQSALRAGASSVADGVNANLRSQRAQVAAERADLLTRFESGHPQVVALTDQLAELDRQLGEAQAEKRQELQRSYNAAIDQERRLASQVDALRGRFQDERRATIQYNILRREVDTNRELYNGLLQRYKEIGVAGVEASNAQLVDAPSIPDEPSSPSLPLNLVLGLLAGFGLAGGFLFVREQIDRTLRDPADVKNVLGLPLLGITPKIDSDNVIDDVEDPNSDMAEAYLSIAANLDLATDHGFPRTAMLTSASPGEGKTSSSYALANRLARDGRNVVLVDFDLRNPSIGKRLELPNERGVTDLLTGRMQVADVLQSGARANLSVITTGKKPPNPGELISSERTGALISELASRFDHVIVDAPPVLGLADAPLLSRRVEGVIFVIEANRMGLRQLSNSVERLRNGNAEIFGAVVSKMDNRNSEYGYGYGYGYGYAYGRTDEETA